MRVATTSFAALLALAGCESQGEAEATRTSDSGTRVQRLPHEPSPRPKAAARKIAKAKAEPAEPEPEPEPEPAPEPERPKPPPGYGALHPSVAAPAPIQLTHYAIAGYEVVAIHDRPDSDSPRLGYLRLGQRERVTARVAGKGCSGTWHQLPDGGFACTGRGLVVDAKREPFMRDPPPPPDKHAPLPYEYAFVKTSNAPMWWRIPTAEERKAAMAKRAELEAVRTGEPIADEPPKVAAKKEEQPLADLPSLDDKPKEEVLASTTKPEPVEAAPPIDLPLNPDKPWLERGFFISLAGKIAEEGNLYWRTARGGYVDANAAMKWGTKDFSGAVLPEEADFPFGFVMQRKGTPLVELTPEGKLIARGELAFKTFVDVSEEIIVNGRAYMLTEDEGLLVRKDHLRLADPQPLPEGLQPYDRWVDVSLAKQMLVAYEGTHPVFVTLVSTGKRGTKDEPFDTPTGRWRIRSKHVSTTMDGNSASDGNYSIQDVPWTMFFHKSFALHGAFWHDGFGRVRSHGCVNLGPSDARWLFEWTTPVVPEGWHGVHAHDGSPGTTIVVRA